MFNEIDDVMDLYEVKSNYHMIFYDDGWEYQNNIRNYFVIGRHNNVYTFYVCQTYSHIPKQLLKLM